MTEYEPVDETRVEHVVPKFKDPARAAGCFYLTFMLVGAKLIKYKNQMASVNADVPPDIQSAIDIMERTLTFIHD